MKTQLIILALAAFCVAKPSKYLKNYSNFIACLLLIILAYRKTAGFRTSLPDEDDALRTKYIIFEEENGEIYFEDLTESHVERSAKPSDIKLYFYPRVNLQITIEGNHLEELKKLKEYDPRKPNYFIIHGWRNYYLSPFNILVKKALHNVTNSNVFVVDWSSFSYGLYYTAYSAVEDMGGFVGDIINGMMDHYRLKPKHFKIIGHSLGAHVAGCAGARMNGKADYIVGLDPAGPYFTKKNTDNRLDETDAKFVQVIHTTDGTLGFGSSIGHADYYPNNGWGQPGCGMTGLSCSHSRSYDFYTESLYSGDFISLACKDWKNYKKGRCMDNDQSFMGKIDVDTG